MPRPPFSVLVPALETWPRPREKRRGDHQHRGDAGAAVLLVSAELSEIRSLCDRVVVMRSGKIVEAGATERVFDAPEHEYTKQLLEAVPTLE